MFGSANLSRNVITRLLFAVVIIFFFSSMVLLNSVYPNNATDCQCDCSKDTTKTALQTQHVLTFEKIEEIALLKDQIHSLQQQLYELRVNSVHTFDVCSQTLCMKEIGVESKVRKTEVFQGHKYKSKSLVQPFTRFTMWQEYPAVNGFSGPASRKLNGEKRLEVDEVVDNSLNFLNSNGSSRQWLREHFMEGVYRYSSGLGTHYELHFEKGSNRSKVTLFRPQGRPLAIKNDNLVKAKSLNIIIPLSGRLDKLISYLDNIIGMLLENTDMYLTVVYFGETLSEFNAIFRPFAMKHSFHRHFIKLISDRPFSRGYALDYGIRAWTKHSDPVIFMCDIDVIFNANFVRRCLVSSVQGKQVYYPILFSLYNPKVVEHFYGQKISSWKQQLKISSDVGFWREFGFGMACMYRSDYLVTGGFRLDRTGWGQEDEDLFEKFAQSTIFIIRAPDPDIFHLWHSKSCDNQLSDEQYRGCIQTKSLTEGSHLQLGYLLFKDDISQRRRRREHL